MKHPLEMSSKKRAFSELSQTSRTPNIRESKMNESSRTTPYQTNRELRSVRSVRYVDARIVQPQSARNILRRFAKVTAPITERRISTPTIKREIRESTDANVQNNDKLRRPTLNFQIEESIEEDDSEIPVAPTPSALLDEPSSDVDEQPTETFHGMRSKHVEMRSDENDALLLIHSEPDASAMVEDMGAEHETTFLTERGRRAISEEATKMSRFSFGSIHMSGFGSELEIRRESGIPYGISTNEVAEDGFVDEQIDLNLGGETENLRAIMAPLSPDVDDDFQPFPDGHEHNDSFQLDIPNEFGDDITAHQRVGSNSRPERSPPSLASDDEDSAEQPADLHNRNEQNIVTTRSTEEEPRVKSRKKLKLNKRGNLVPAIPSSLIKRIVHESCRLSKKRKMTLGKEHMRALEQATEWYFEQVSEDLEAFASHGKRKKRIDESDVLLMMRRQRLLQNDGELRTMAKQWLPAKDFAQLDLPD